MWFIDINRVHKLTHKMIQHMTILELFNGALLNLMADYLLDSVKPIQHVTHECVHTGQQSIG